MRRQTLLLLFTLTLLALSIILIQGTDLRLPGSHTGYQPQQPIEFSHRLHSGDLDIPCLYCHGAAEKGRHAGIPAAATCMNCHRFVLASWDNQKIEEDEATSQGREGRVLVSEELQKLYRAVDFDWEAMQYRRGDSQERISWVRVHRLPDFVYFDHRSHVGAGVECQICHGPVESMERVSQESDLSMGWCVECHRDVGGGTSRVSPVEKASTDCGVCHY